MTRLGVLVSGRGTNLAAILRACARGDIPGQVVFVASNKPTCPALQVAREGGVPNVRAFTLTEYGDLPARDAAMAVALKDAGVELVVTAGYDRVLDEGFVAAFEGRILNVHPSLLPEFGGGMDAIQEALNAGAEKTGVTVHLIEPGTVDAGRILAQEKVEILPGDTLETLADRVHAVEHRLLPQSIKAYIEGSLVR